MFADIVELPSEAEDGVIYAVNRTVIVSLAKYYERLLIQIRYSNVDSEEYRFRTREALDSAYAMLKG